jgi:hypothetical protein
MPNRDAYVSVSVGLLKQPETLKRLKAHLLQKRARLPVFDAPTRTRQLEAAYQAAYQRCLKGLPPDHLRVKVGVKKSDDVDTVKPESPAAARVATR